ncbi:uncharacterized protein [Epargyreus clarus]|uniref:uncharacterized protein n=1 Tax=Epargyreus clarus TaxID=520877 RepID=UPI003C2E467D
MSIPTGDEVQPGSVLLPATRRGRYLANIVRRQAVDGTGIKFNKDADRMNAEAKKKVDVLSEELLPYIIAEQERRTTLYKRVMTAVQNGEKGVTVAEIRNKPPLIIRKGLLYRCPSNRAPKEPDGSGILMCEGDIEPTQVMFDSCLSAEDKELYVAENRYFFCNRHKVEGPDLPRNGTTVIGCAPIERTSLNYTTNNCALEDTDDVVVHYRYYPDRTYKYVTELDPDREVCDHWNPCQIGYIYSLPSPDQAMPANELWKDSMEEWVPPNSKNYTSSPRQVQVPEGYNFHGIVHKKMHTGAFEPVPEKFYSADEVDTASRRLLVGKWLMVSISFTTWSSGFFGPYYVHFQCPNKKDKYRKFISLSQSAMMVTPRSVELLYGQKANATIIPFKCNHCRLLHILVRATDSNIYNLDSSRYRVKEYRDRQQYFEANFQGLMPQDFGDYFAVVQNGDGIEERVKIASVRLISTVRIFASYDVGGHFDRTMNYSCTECALTDILCNGDSVLSAGRVSIVPMSNLISFNFPRFDNSHACVYMGFFREKEKVYKKVLAIIDTVVISQMVTVNSPKQGEQFEQTISYSCEECSVDKVFVNGVPLESSSRRSSVGSVAFFVATATEINVRITEFSDTFEGVYQAEFLVAGDPVTKTIMEIRDPLAAVEPQPGGETTTPAPETTVTADAGSTEAPAEGGETTEAPPEAQAVKKE